VTLGAQGIFYSSHEAEGHLPPPAVKIVDVTGAGDAFTSGFLYGVIHDQSFPSACQLGLEIAALTLQTVYSVSPLLHPNLIEPLLEDKQ
jgi:pseudouridine kinase